MECGKKWFLMDFVQEQYIAEAFPEKEAYFAYKSAAKAGRGKRIGKSVRAVCMAAGICLFVLLWFGATYPSAAAKLPIVGGMFRYIQEKLEFGGNYEGYADEVGAVYSNNGVSVTVSEAYCDGNVLVISYKVESKTAFRDYPGDLSTSGQMYYNGESVMEENGTLTRLEEVGVAGLEGRFLDETTFVGAEMFPLWEESYPEEFELNVSIFSLGLQDNKNKEIYWIPGNWRFKIPVRVNGENVRTYEINQWNGEYSVDCVKVTPFVTTVYTSYPEEEYEDAPFDYMVLAYGSREEREISRMGRDDGGRGVTMIPTEEIGDRLDIYAVDVRGWSTDRCVKEEFEKEALVHTVIDLEE